MSTPGCYAEFYRLSIRFMQAVDDWANSHNARNESYHRAKNLWDQMSVIAYQNKEYCKQCVEYMQAPTTIYLRELLCCVDYNEDGLLDLNAMSLLDTCSTKI